MKKDSKVLPFRNVALLPEDHALLKKIADRDQRTMTRQLSVIIRREHEKLEDFDKSQAAARMN